MIECPHDRSRPGRSGAFAFLKRNLHHVQRGQGFNSPGKLDTPEAALEELLYRLTAAGRQWLQSRQKG